MRHPELRPSVSHRPDERPPAGAVSTAIAAAFALLVLGAIAPVATGTGVLISACIVVTADRRSR